MPTYEYRCSACGHQFEKFHSITADPIKLCPQCGKKKVKRLIGAGAGIIFKGSGFYITDYRSDGYKSAAKSDSGSSSSASPTPSTGNHSKPSETTAAASASTASSSSATPAATPAKSESKSSAAASSKK